MTPYILLATLSSLTASELLNRSIAYDDPHGVWERGAFEIFDNARSRFEMQSTVDGRALSVVAENDKVEVRLDGTRALPVEARAGLVKAQQVFLPCS